MPAGRIPTPQRIAELKGDSRRTKQVEPTPPPGAPAMPASVEADEIARQEWVEITKVLDDMGLLARSDKTLLTIYCATFSRWCKANERCREFGEIILTPEKKYPQVSPYAATRNKSQDQLYKLLIEMGLTPAARSRLAVKDAEDKSALRWKDLVA